MKQAPLRSAAAVPLQVARSGPPRWVWISTALSVLTVVNLSMANDDPMLDLGQTSYGKSSDGFGAVYDLLSELDPHSTRSRERYQTLATDRTLWLLAPEFLAEGSDAALPEPLRGDATLSAELDAWIARGGTAVVFGLPLSDWSHYQLTLAKVAEHEKENEQDDAQVKRVPHVAVPSTLARQLRAIEIEGLRNFAPELPAGFERVLGTPDAPFAVRKQIGKGRLLAVADARPFANKALDGADHANLAVDLARAFGTPIFDERCHGLLPERSLSSALGRRRLLLLAFGLGLCLLLALWHLRSVPASSIARLPGLDPGLESFVDSLALLYSRKAPRDAGAVYRAYLHGVRFRMRQQLYGARGGSELLLGQRLERDFAQQPELLARLNGQRTPRNERELLVAARTLERAVASLSERRDARTRI